MMTDSSAQEDQQCNAAKLLEVTILQCRGHMDQVLCCLDHGKCNVIVAVCCICTGLESSKKLLATLGVAKALRRLNGSPLLMNIIFTYICLFNCLFVCLFCSGFLFMWKLHWKD